MTTSRILLVCAALLMTFSSAVFAESQGNDYKGITDPFGDPSNYEFAEDEKEDKEFFHLGRFLTFGVDLGIGAFTGGLGLTNSPAFLAGARLVYFFDRSLAVEAAVHFAKHQDVVVSGSQRMVIDAQVIPITIGFRYYFDVKNAPKALALANPYLALAGGMYMRMQNVVSNTGGFQVGSSEGSESSFGAQGGGGVEFNVYRQHIYIGADIRYHFVFFADESQTFQLLQPGDRGGDYFTGALSLTYSF